MDAQQIFHNLTIKLLTALSKSKSRISFREPSIWNNFVQNSEKETESPPLFKSKLKLKLLSFSNENPVDEKGLDYKAIVAFCKSFLVLKTNMNLII